MGEGAGYGIAGEMAANVACRTGKLCGPVNRVRKGQGLMVNMGASPHTPYYDNGIVRRGGVCGAHILCEHVLFGEIASGFACGKRKTGEHVFTEKIIISLRVIGTTRESMRPLANELPAARVGLASSAFPTFGYCPPQERVRD